MAFARSLPSPRFYEALQGAEPLTEPYGFRKAENRLRHYDRLPAYLENFLLAGDAVYALNPVYGQGMTVAAMGSKTLAACLERQRRRRDVDLTGLAREFQKQLGKVVAAPWQLATGEDRRWPGTDGEGNLDWMTRTLQSYFSRVLRTMVHDQDVAETFMHVQQMVKSPAALFHPRILWKVLRSQPQDTTDARSVVQPYAAPSAAAGD
jgi:flavin-dependent dehydrogenase